MTSAGWPWSTCVTWECTARRGFKGGKHGTESEQPHWLWCRAKRPFMPPPSRPSRARRRRRCQRHSRGTHLRAVAVKDDDKASAGAGRGLPACAQRPVIRRARAAGDGPRDAPAARHCLGRGRERKWERGQARSFVLRVSSLEVKEVERERERVSDERSFSAVDFRPKVLAHARHTHAHTHAHTHLNNVRGVPSFGFKARQGLFLKVERERPENAPVCCNRTFFFFFFVSLLHNP